MNDMDVISDVLISYSMELVIFTNLKLFFYYFMFISDLGIG